MTGARRFLALGDSYTIGEGVPVSERWPVQLANELRELDVPISDPRIIARTGWTTDELLAAIESAAPPVERYYDLVTLLIGVNDQYRGRSVDSFEAGLTRLLQLSKTFATAPSRVVVVSIPDWSVTPFARTDPRGAPAIAREITEFNTVVQEMARSVGAAFVDVTAISRRAAESPELLAADGLHPSAAMYRMWIQEMLPVARQLLG